MRRSLVVLLRVGGAVRDLLLLVVRLLLRVGGALRDLLLLVVRLLLRVGGACGPPPPVAAPLASSLRAPFRGDPPHDGPAAAGCAIYRSFASAGDAERMPCRSGSHTRRASATRKR